jgi:SET domain-containing protein
MNYKPLPKQVTIKKSSIDGLGLFAIKNIKKDTILGITHISNKEYQNGYIRTPLGGFINHSKKPNAKLIGCGDSRDIDCGTLFLKTIQDIEAGQEILLTYKMYEV